MCAINVGFHLFRTQEGIVDIGVDGIRMVNIDHSRPKIVGIINELITVIETILPLLVGVDGAERGDQYIKIIVEIPTHISAKGKATLEEFSKIEGEKTNPSLIALANLRN